ncbi:hypothetical protein ERY430_40239 [Erythrobacter sp. EC-HK427]|nr:hypothetical protein ERY430_40239 [Erythrobacter sp. EC-HK427]
MQCSTIVHDSFAFAQIGTQKDAGRADAQVGRSIVHHSNLKEIAHAYVRSQPFGCISFCHRRFVGRSCHGAGRR